MQIYVENSAGGDVGSGVQIYFDDLSVKELSTTDELLIPTENYVTSAGDPLIKNTEEFHSITSNESKLYATSERFIHQSVDGTT
jgi:hypothetical protein